MATESRVTTEGSHPFSTGLDLCLVHNGSLSNHNRLRQNLRKRGIRFETDNEFATLNPSYSSDAVASLNQPLLRNAGIDDGWVPGRDAGYHLWSSMQILGECVQRATGRRYPDFVREEIFHSAGARTECRRPASRSRRSPWQRPLRVRARRATRIPEQASRPRCRS